MSSELRFALHTAHLHLLKEDEDNQDRRATLASLNRLFSPTDLSQVLLRQERKPDWDYCFIYF